MKNFEQFKKDKAAKVKSDKAWSKAQLIAEKDATAKMEAMKARLRAGAKKKK